jgi:iron(III) transport system ATP-binding protein
MNRGRVEQVGSPEDIYQRPHSEFVARFIGGTNIFRGRRVDDGMVDCGAALLRCGAGETSSQEVAVSIRPHDIRISATKPASPEPNTAAGRVVRQSYLGAHRDYLVELADTRQVRVTAPLEINVPVGGMVGLTFPPEHCRALAQ